MHRLLRKVRELRLPEGSYAIFGSGPLLVRGVIDEVSDIDIVCREPAWSSAKALGEVLRLPEYDLDVVSIGDARITVGTVWGIGEFNTDELIDTAEIIEALPFVRLDYVVAYKRIANRPKDRAHLERLRHKGLLS